MYFLPQLKHATANSTWKRLEVRNAQRQLLTSHGRTIDYSRTYVRLLSSPLDLSWPAAVDHLMEMQAVTEKCQPLSPMDVLRCAVEIQSSNAVDVRELVAEVYGTTFLNPTEGIVCSICEQLLSFLPALLIESSGRFVMVNAHEVAFAAATDTLADLLCLADDKPKPSSVVDDKDENQGQSVQPPSTLEDLNVVHGPFMKPGQKANPHPYSSQPLQIK